MVDQVRTTAREFLNLPEAMLPTELIEGDIVVSPAPSDEHQRISGLFHLYLAPRLPGGQLRYAPVDVVLDDMNVVQPDLFWVSETSAQSALREDGRWHGAPEFIVEIFSPGTERRDRGVMFELYERHGVREYWMVDVEAQYVEVQARQGDRFARLGVFGPGESFHSPLLDRDFEVSALLGIDAAEHRMDQETS